MKHLPIRANQQKYLDYFFKPTTEYKKDTFVNAMVIKEKNGFFVKYVCFIEY